ncbi:MerR family transcriptional regulator [Streptomyces sp. NPDC048172]|uniref:MerR family transcriptional regulator n=1 Tax=Streptomyces sp. NPDC048172 TaxID=3365505 RepID=UPI0037199391
MMRISQLAERSGVPATTLRFYESAGLLPSGRTPAGYRTYDESALDRLAFIGAAKHLGLPLEEIGELLGVWAAGACADVKADLRPRIAARLEEARRRTAELSGLTATLHAAMEHLDALPDRTGPCDPDCDFLAERDERWRSEPVACSLNGDGLRERTVQWREAIHGALRTPAPDGVRLTLPADRAQAIAALASAEQRCCPFFDFRLHFDGPRLHLDVRAPAESADLLAELFGPAA